jgi:stage V sporulation protein G
MIQITDVQIYVVNEDKLKAYATITLDNAFLIRDLKVIKGHTGLFVAMPAKKRKDGVFRDIAHPLNQSMRDHLEELVLKAFQEATSQQPDGVTSLPSGTEGY